MRPKRYHLNRYQIKSHIEANPIEASPCIFETYQLMDFYLLQEHYANLYIYNVTTNEVMFFKREGVVLPKGERKWLTTPQWMPIFKELQC